jgi:hypothetical protein
MRTPEDNQKVVFHSKSVLADERDFPSPWIIYKLKQKTMNVCLFDGSVASPCSLLFFGKEAKAKPAPRGGNEKGGRGRSQQVLSADKHVKFKSSDSVAHMITVSTVIQAYSALHKNLRIVENFEEKKNFLVLKLLLRHF